MIETKTIKNVLIISYHYPPRATVGSLRPYGLTKYLPQFGWQPTIVSCQDYTPSPLAKRLGLNQNQNLLSQVQDLQNKYRFLPIKFLATRYAEIMYYPDPMKGWATQAIVDSTEIIKNNKVNAIISTSFPATCHIVASKLATEFHIPWIADFRDLWTQSHYYPYSPIRRVFESALELKTLGRARALVTVSEPLAEQLKSLHRRSISVIMNGYNTEEVNKGIPLTKERTITHTGNIYPEHQSPEPFFRELASQENRGTVVRFYGPKQSWIDQMARGYGLQDIVRQYGMIPRQEALQRQWESHALLYLPWQGQEGIYSQKLFEYLAAKRPIIVSGQADPYIQKVIDASKNGGIEKYSQVEMARKFAGLLNNL